MSGTHEGAILGHARRWGIGAAEYKRRARRHQKWCTSCKAWHPRSAFALDRSRSDGLAAYCKQSRRTGHPRGWHGRAAINPVTGRPGPAPTPPRDDDRRQARQRINVEVRSGRRLRPNALPCVDCGHVWRPGERRHEYDHHLGYSSAHHLDVQAVCTLCHHKRGRLRG